MPPLYKGGNGTSIAAFLEAAGLTAVVTNMNISSSPSTVLSPTQHVSTYVLFALRSS